MILADKLEPDSVMFLFELLTTCLQELIFCDLFFLGIASWIKIQASRALHPRCE